MPPPVSYGGTGLGIEDKDRLVRYLLGDLPEADHQLLEKECLADDRLSEALREVENDLLDSYACGELSEKQRQQFERNFLDSPEKHEQLEIARLLMNPSVRQQIATTAIQSSQEQRSGWQSLSSILRGRHLGLKLAAVAAGIAVAAVPLFLVMQNQRLGMEVSRLQSEQTKFHQQIAELQRTVNANNAGQRNAGDGSGAEKPPPLVTVSALLKSGLPRQGGSGRGNSPLTIPPATSSVTLLLDLESDRYSRYNVVLETAEGEIVRRIRGLRSQPARAGRIIEVRLPPQALPSGDYLLTLSGAEPNSTGQVVDSYSFSVSR